MPAAKRRPQKLTGSAALRLRAQIRIKFTLKVRRTSVTSCDPGRETSAQIKAGYKCPLPQESRETRAPQQSLFPNSGQTRVPRAPWVLWAAPPRGLARTGPTRNQGRIALPPRTPHYGLVPASLGPRCHRDCFGEGGSLEKRGFPGSFY